VTRPLPPYQTSDGFTWGPADVGPWATFPRDNGRYLVIRVRTPYRLVDIYVSPTGRTVRVFRDHTELKGTR